MTSVLRDVRALRGTKAIPLALLLVSCAKVAPPLPPLQVIQPVRDLSLNLEPNRTYLEFSLPQAELSAVEVLVACGSQTVEEKDFRLMARITRGKLIAAAGRPDRYSFIAPPGEPCHYVVRLVDPSGSTSPFSNVARTP